jgi:hypothetical protein
LGHQNLWTYNEVIWHSDSLSGRIHCLESFFFFWWCSATRRVNNVTQIVCKCFINHFYVCQKIMQCINALRRNLAGLCNVLLDVFIQNIFSLDLCNVPFILVEVVKLFSFWPAHFKIILSYSSWQTTSGSSFTHSLSGLSFVLQIHFHTIYPLHEEAVVKEKVYLIHRLERNW